MQSLQVTEKEAAALAYLRELDFERQPHATFTLIVADDKVVRSEIHRSFIKPNRK